MKTEEENTCEINESVPSSSETTTSTAAALNVAIANEREEQEKEVKEEDVGPEYFQFQCALCSFDVRARYGDLKIGKLGYQGKVYYTRSPFREFDRTKKFTLRDYVIVGSKCCQCSRDICVKIQCSFFYELNYCVTCIMQNRGNFPAKVIEVCNMFFIGFEKGDFGIRIFRERNWLKSWPSRSLDSLTFFGVTVFIILPIKKRPNKYLW